MDLHGVPSSDVAVPAPGASPKDSSSPPPRPPVLLAPAASPPPQLAPPQGASCCAARRETLAPCAHCALRSRSSTAHSTSLQPATVDPSGKPRLRAEREPGILFTSVLSTSAKQQRFEPVSLCNLPAHSQRRPDRPGSRAAACAAAAAAAVGSEAATSASASKPAAGASAAAAKPTCVAAAHGRPILAQASLTAAAATARCGQHAVGGRFSGAEEHGVGCGLDGWGCS